MSIEKLETLFAIEFGQLLENYLYSNARREELTDVICSCLQLRNKQQLAQIYAGYDIPSTANIFELIRTLNDDEFTMRFFKLQTTLPEVAVSRPEEVVEQAPVVEVSTERKPYWMVEDEDKPAEYPKQDENDLRKNDAMFDELADMDMDMMKGMDFNL